MKNEQVLLYHDCGIFCTIVLGITEKKESAVAKTYKTSHYLVENNFLT